MNILKTGLSVLLALGVAVSPLSMPIMATANETKQKSVVERLADLFRPARRGGRTRGGVCLLTPEATHWSDRPLFVWDFKVGKDKLRPGTISKVDVQTANDHRLIWSQVITSNGQSVIYQGESLQPGQTYEVILYDAAGKPLITDELLYPRFTLIEGAKRQQIEADLTKLTKRLNMAQATAEAIAVEKAIYFSEQKLWSDAFQTIYSLPNPSAELRQMISRTTQDACNGS